MGIASAAVVAGWLTVASGNGADPHAAKTAAAARAEAQITALRPDSAALAARVRTTDQRVEARSAFLAAIATGRRGDIASASALLPANAMLGDDEEVTGGVMTVPVRAAYNHRASASPQQRLHAIQTVVARLGLSTARFAGGEAVGGPYIPAGIGGNDPVDSNADIARIEAGMNALPSFMPVANFHYTSGFGGRIDPFRGGEAMHPGLDMAGNRGEAIYATADGIVSRATWAGGYGNCVDLEHGKGIATRYGHLSAILVQEGQHVRRGQLIARMGSTGRSTGNHLHYEVRVDGRAVNPKPFLDAINYVLAVQSHAVAGPELASAG